LPENGAKEDYSSLPEPLQEHDYGSLPVSDIPGGVTMAPPVESEHDYGDLPPPTADGTLPPPAATTTPNPRWSAYAHVPKSNARVQQVN